MDNMIILVTFRYSLYRSKIKDLDFHETISKEIALHLKYDNHNRNYCQDKDLYKRLKREGAFNYKYVESISIVTHSNKSLDIVPIFMYALPEITEESVSHCIKLKNEKLKVYSELPSNTDVSEFWLTIVIPWNAYTQIGNLPSFNIDSDYTHIYITDPYEYKQLK